MNVKMASDSGWWFCYPCLWCRYPYSFIQVAVYKYVYGETDETKKGRLKLKLNWRMLSIGKKSSQNDIKKFSVFRMKTFHFLKLTHAHIVRFLIQFNVKKFQNRFVSLVCLFVVEKKMNFSLSFQKKFQVFFHYFCVCFDSLSTFVEKKMFTKWKKTMKLRIEKKVKFNDGGIYQQNFFFFW